MQTHIILSSLLYSQEVGKIYNSVSFVVKCLHLFSVVQNADFKDCAHYTPKSLSTVKKYPARLNDEQEEQKIMLLPFCQTVLIRLYTSRQQSILTMFLYLPSILPIIAIVLSLSA